MKPASFVDAMVDAMSSEWLHRFPTERLRTPVRWISAGMAQALISGAIWGAATNTPVAGLRDIRGPFEIQTWGDILRLGALVLGLAALLGLAWWLWRRRKPSGDVEPGINPGDRARTRLSEALVWIQQPERFCTAVSEIIRTYLEERFGLRAPERTTEEFLLELARSAALDARHKALLGEFLTQCDLAKFAQARPDLGELELLHASGLRLVDETTGTKPVPPLLGPTTDSPPPT